MQRAATTTAAIARDTGIAAEKRALAGDDAAAALARLDATIAFRRNRFGGQVVADIRRDSRRYAAPSSPLG
jgi:hypothetical protein